MIFSNVVEVSMPNLTILNIGTEGADKMSYDYRVVYIPDEDVDFFVIREVFYNEDGDIIYWSEEDAVPTGETFEELCDDFDAMAEAFEKPVLMLQDGELIELEDEEEESDAE